MRPTSLKPLTIDYLTAIKQLHCKGDVDNVNAKLMGLGPHESLTFHA
jgi:hypothetical protein